MCSRGGAWGGGEAGWQREAGDKALHQGKSALQRGQRSALGAAVHAPRAAIAGAVWMHPEKSSGSQSNGQTPPKELVRLLGASCPKRKTEQTRHTLPSMCTRKHRQSGHGSVTSRKQESKEEAGARFASCRNKLLARPVRLRSARPQPDSSESTPPSHIPHLEHARRARLRAIAAPDAPCGTHSPDGMSPLWPPAPGKAIELLFAISPRLCLCASMRHWCTEAALRHRKPHSKKGFKTWFLIESRTRFQ
uniref:Uncharacterized protein n=1 Tax=Rangifer tarandus platyrhynchus TaxID=3082113 RepID=A0ACB0EI25_RANTA|nr:unnamed protein product [Rangifer tarandus platyrhynchus]